MGSTSAVSAKNPQNTDAKYSFQSGVMRFAKWFKGASAAGSGGGAPAWTGGPVTLNIVQINSISGAGVLYGYMDHMNYGEPGAGPYGTADAHYFRDLRPGATSAVVRLAGVISQGNGYLVFGWEASALAADPVTMPPMTWKIKIDGGTTYDFTSSPAAGSGAPVNSRYMVVNVGWAGGQTHTIDFV